MDVNSRPNHDLTTDSSLTSEQNSSANTGQTSAKNTTFDLSSITPVFEESKLLDSPASSLRSPQEHGKLTPRSAKASGSISKTRQTLRINAPLETKHQEPVSHAAQVRGSTETKQSLETAAGLLFQPQGSFLFRGDVNVYEAIDQQNSYAKPALNASGTLQPAFYAANETEQKTLPGVPHDLHIAGRIGTLKSYSPYMSATTQIDTAAYYGTRSVSQSGVLEAVANPESEPVKVIKISLEALTPTTAETTITAQPKPRVLSPKALLRDFSKKMALALAQVKEAKEARTSLESAIATATNKRKAFSNQKKQFFTNASPAVQTTNSKLKNITIGKLRDWTWNTSINKAIETAKENARPIAEKQHLDLMTSEFIETLQLAQQHCHKSIAGSNEDGFNPLDTPLLKTNFGTIRERFSNHVFTNTSNSEAQIKGRHLFTPKNQSRLKEMKTDLLKALHTATQASIDQTDSQTSQDSLKAYAKTVESAIQSFTDGLGKEASVENQLNSIKNPLKSFYSGNPEPVAYRTLKTLAPGIVQLLANEFENPEILKESVQSSFPDTLKRANFSDEESPSFDDVFMDGSRNTLSEIIENLGGTQIDCTEQLRYDSLQEHFESYQSKLQDAIFNVSRDNEFLIEGPVSESDIELVPVTEIEVPTIEPSVAQSMQMLHLPLGVKSELKTTLQTLFTKFYQQSYSEAHVTNKVSNVKTKRGTGDDVKQGDSTAFKANHGLTHAARQAFLSVDLVQLLTNTENASPLKPWLQTSQKNDSHFLEKVAIASAYQRNGRESEVSSTQNRALFAQYVFKSSTNFAHEMQSSPLFAKGKQGETSLLDYQAAILKAINMTDEEIIQSATTEKLDQPTIEALIQKVNNDPHVKNLGELLEVSHLLDLRRIPVWFSEKRDEVSGLLGLDNDTDNFDQIVDTMDKRSKMYIHSTGILLAHHFSNSQFKTEMEKFAFTNTNAKSPNKAQLRSYSKEFALLSNQPQALLERLLDAQQVMSEMGS